jgi:hypothetical protein
VFPIGVNGVWYALVIAPGFYADLTAVTEAIQEQIETYVGADIIALNINTGNGRRYRLEPLGSATLGIWAFLPLISYFGFVPSQVGTFGTAGVDLVARNSYYSTLPVDFRIAQLAIRFGRFGRSAQ